MSRSLDLITDCATGQLSHTKLWTQIAYCAATIAFLRINLFSDAPIDVYLWAIYLGTLSGHNIISKALSIKQGRRNDPNSY